jgi:hypothetical protein
LRTDFLAALGAAGFLAGLGAAGFLAGFLGTGFGLAAFLTGFLGTGFGLAAFLTGFLGTGFGLAGFLAGFLGTGFGLAAFLTGFLGAGLRVKRMTVLTSRLADRFWGVRLVGLLLGERFLALATTLRRLVSSTFILARLLRVVDIYFSNGKRPT